MIHPCMYKALFPCCGCLHVSGHLANHWDQRAPQEPRSSGPRTGLVKLPWQQWFDRNQKHPNRLDYLLWVSSNAFLCFSLYFLLEQAYFSADRFAFKSFSADLGETTFCYPSLIPVTTARAVWRTWPSLLGWSPVSTTTCHLGPLLWTLRRLGGMRMFP